MVSKKTTSRLAAVLALYLFEIQNHQQNLTELQNAIIDFYSAHEAVEDNVQKDGSRIKFNKNFFENLLTNTINNLSEIDQIISSYLNQNWTIEKLDAILLSILRIAISELKYYPDTPYKVVINEYTNLASDLAKDQDVAFVNSMLDKFAKEN